LLKRLIEHSKVFENAKGKRPHHFVKQLYRVEVV